MNSAAHSKTWRTWFMAFCALTAALLLFQIVFSATAKGSNPAIIWVSTQTPFVERVVSSPSHSPVHIGDLIDYRTQSPIDRWCWSWSDCFHPGQSIALTVRRNGQVLRVNVIAGPPSYYGVSFGSLASWPFWLSVVGAFWMIAFGALIAWRRPGSREARVLALLLVLNLFGIALSNLIWPSAISVLFDVAGQICVDVSLALLATYAMLFKPASRVRTLLAWSTYALCAFSIVQICVGVFAMWTAAIDLNTMPFAWMFSQTVSLVLLEGPLVLPVMCGALAIAETRGAERARLSWTMASLGADFLLNALRYLVPVTSPWYSIVSAIGDGSLFIAPLGLTYALLNRTLLDVGFALNRAAIFTAVSVVVVGIFVLVEWAFGEWLRDASHTANVAASGGLALVLGLSVRFVHGRVEHVVDNVFFRKRHEDEAALRTFAHEAGYINNPDTLIARTIAIIERHADASSVQLAIDDGRGCYGNVNEDDPAIVALRTWHKALDLHSTETALRGDIAFPMIARGRLVGALVLGPKRSGEAYAPDESDAMMQVAQSVGTSLAVLDRKPSAAADSLEEIRALILEGQNRTAGEIRALSQRLDARNGSTAIGDTA